MFCPQCQYEYRPGFTRCADCDVDLVSELPSDGSHADSDSNKDHSAVWEGTSQDTCVALCRRLREAGVPYEVARQEDSPWFKRQNLWQYQILVPAEDSERAQKIVKQSGAVNDRPLDDSALTADAEAHSDQQATDYFEEDEDAAEAAAEEDALEARAAAYSQPFYAEDATEKISEEPDAEAASMIEASLRENYIHCRIEPQTSGSSQIFVQPDDAAHAREIVREIHDASAPE